MRKASLKLGRIAGSKRSSSASSRLRRKKPDAACRWIASGSSSQVDHAPHPVEPGVQRVGVGDRAARVQQQQAGDREDDVVAGGPQPREHARQVAGPEHVIRVGEAHPGPAREIQAVVAGGGEPLVLLPHHAHRVRRAPRPLPHQGAGPVGRAVVDHDELDVGQVGGPQALGVERREEVGQEEHDLVRGDD